MMQTQYHFILFFSVCVIDSIFFLPVCVTFNLESEASVFLICAFRIRRVVTNPAPAPLLPHCRTSELRQSRTPATPLRSKVKAGVRRTETRRGRPRKEASAFARRANNPKN